MSLAKQLFYGILVIFIMMFVSVFIITVDSGRHYLQNQLQSHAQDTASALGLSLSMAEARAHNNPAYTNAMINAIFEHGYYQEISVADMNGKVIAQRIEDPKLSKVPPWFIRMIKLKAPQEHSQILSGWQQVGQVLVQSNPGYAYQQLWKNLKGTFFSLLSYFAVALLLGLFLVQMLKRSLFAITEQAEAICHRNFYVNPKLPRIPEMRIVVEAMNKLSSKMKSLFSEQAKLIEELREKTFRDSNTNLGNRR